MIIKQVSQLEDCGKVVGIYLKSSELISKIRTTFVSPFAADMLGDGSWLAEIMFLDDGRIEWEGPVNWVGLWLLWEGPAIGNRW